jgi:hypothetical protein
MSRHPVTGADWPAWIFAVSQGAVVGAIVLVVVLLLRWLGA